MVEQSDSEMALIYIDGSLALFLILQDPETEPRMRAAWPGTLEGGQQAQISWDAVLCPTLRWAEALTMSARAHNLGGGIGREAES